MKPSASKASTINALQGIVIAAHGRHCVVRTDQHAALLCTSRGKRNETACGDHVTVELTSVDQGVINRVNERRNTLYRSDEMRTKIFAVNVDRVFVVLAAQPTPSLDLLARAMIACAHQHIALTVLLNKADLAAPTQALQAQLAFLQHAQVQVVTLSAKTNTAEALAALTPLTANQTTVFIGQSGMGKSSLINLLVPNALAATGEISERLDSGKHTTTTTVAYALGDQADAGWVIDSPGFQNFGLAHIKPEEVLLGFADFSHVQEPCKFYNCLHTHEPDCGLRNALAQGTIEKQRYAQYVQLVQEAQQTQANLLVR